MSCRYKKIKEDMPLSAAKIEDNTEWPDDSLPRQTSFISLYLPLSSSISFYLRKKQSLNYIIL